MGFFKQDCGSGLLFPPPNLDPNLDQISISCISFSGRQILYHCTTWESCTQKQGSLQKGKKYINRAVENLNLGVGGLQLQLLEAFLNTAIKADHRERAVGKAYCVCPGVRERWAGAGFLTTRY